MMGRVREQRHCHHGRIPISIEQPGRGEYPSLGRNRHRIPIANPNRDRLIEQIGR